MAGQIPKGILSILPASRREWHQDLEEFKFCGRSAQRVEFGDRCLKVSIGHVRATAILEFCQIAEKGRRDECCSFCTE